MRGRVANFAPSFFGSLSLVSWHDLIVGGYEGCKDLSPAAQYVALFWQHLWLSQASACVEKPQGAKEQQGLRLEQKVRGHL